MGSVAFSSGKVAAVKTVELDMPAGAGVIQWFTLDSAVNGTQEMLMVSVTDSAGTVVCDNPVAFAHPKNMSLPKASVSFEVGAQEEGGGPVAITLSSDNFALYVT